MRRPVQIRVNAVVVAVTDGRPLVLTVPGDRFGSSSDLAALPAGTLDPEDDRTLELAVRRLVRQQTGTELGYVEQLYTFGDIGREPAERTISIAHLALVRQEQIVAAEGVDWTDGYSLLPWEDWRAGRPEVIDADLAPILRDWAGDAADHRERANITFGLGGSPWDRARVLERYELLYEVGLVAERQQDMGEPVTEHRGVAMVLDHRRMVATALGRLRGKLSYRPVIFELVAETFTLNQLQLVVETLAGVPLHKPNFRRLVDRGGIVEGTGVADTKTGGRPAELFRFRRDVLRERPAPGVGLPGAR